MIHVETLSTLLGKGLSTFNRLLIVWKNIIKFMSNKYNPPYIRPHVIFLIAQGDLPRWKNRKNMSCVRNVFRISLRILHSLFGGGG